MSVVPELKALPAEVDTDDRLKEYFETALKLAHKRQSLTGKAADLYPSNTLLKQDYELATHSCLILTAVLRVVEEHALGAPNVSE